MVAPVVAAALIGGAAAIGGALSGQSAAKKEAKKNREFQLAMSNTAHQREVEDLRKAGLNPILSGTGGMGASTPAGATASLPDLGSTIGQSSAKALDSMLIKEQIRLTEEQREKVAQEGLTEVERTKQEAIVGEVMRTTAHERNIAEINNIKAQAVNNTASAGQANTTTQLLKTELPGAKNKETIDSSKAGVFLEGVKKAREAIFGGSSASSIRDSLGPRK